MTSDRQPGGSDWSEPTLSAPTEGTPEAPPTPDPAPKKQARPEPKSEPVFTSIPFTPIPVARRARPRYETGSVPRRHENLIERAADIAVAAMPIPLRVLDVGCGDSKLLEELVVRVPYAEAYIGVDPDGNALQAAASQTPDTHISFVQAAAEALPFPNASFDLVIATASFAYWVDQRVGAGELARVVTASGVIVLVDPVKYASRHRDRARSMSQITKVLDRAGLKVGRTETVHRSRMLRRPTTRAVIAFR